MKKVLITGGSGVIGRHLCEMLKEKGYQVSLLSRDRKKVDGIQSYYWNAEKNEIDVDALKTADYIIHLAGANIGEKRWTKRRKKLIVDSRVKSGELIFDAIKYTNYKPKAFITASAVGYYGTKTTENVYIESDPPATDFLGTICNYSEKVASQFENIGIRTVKIRTGVVLTKHGSALSKMLYPIKLGIGSAIGNGKQYMPWIHITDLCNMYIKAIEDVNMNGAYNAVAPMHITNNEFTRTIAHVIKKPYWFPKIPAFIMKIIFGKMSAILLYGSRVSCDKIIKSGYVFKYPDLKSALTDLVGK
jgi:uncharacterized protein (TIGR01777 family)